MKKYLDINPWKIVESNFNTKNNRVSESNFSIGNGRFGQRGNFEETYSGETLQGSYVAGVYYPDKTRVGWWKNGYPEYFAKVLNAPNWSGIKVSINQVEVDLAKMREVHNFRRELDLQHGVLSRIFEATMPNGSRIRVSTKRFCSLDDSDVAAIEYSVKMTKGDGIIEFESFTDGRIKNADSNYDIKFWKGVFSDGENGQHSLITRTKKTNFHVAIGTLNTVSVEDDNIDVVEHENTKKYASSIFRYDINEGQTATLIKRIIILSSLNHPKKRLRQSLVEGLNNLKKFSFNQLLKTHSDAWLKKWEESDIKIEGDDEAQQGIRFNIFQLNCTYSGEDERLNIGPKGFTGEKYGGSTYWDTEAYCLPFYQATSLPNVARNLLIYRYKHLQKAIENAALLGFKNGAALYPMVTMNGEECHNEWEITFEEIHRNGAIAYAIYDYIKYTGEKVYLASHGLEVLIAIARFWSQRVNWSEDKKQFVLLGVTGPNEFENNVNNNWYTNKIASWCMNYAAESIQWVKNEHVSDYKRIVEQTNFDSNEVKTWKNITANMYYPYSEKHEVFLQQDGFLDKELIPAKEIPTIERPIVEHWSWDRILRSCYIKQADVLQGFYFFEDEFDLETTRRHFDFYEPLTVHESSLSPCVHSILSSKLGYREKAYEFYLRTARLDLDDYNNDTCDGLHITSMAGTWMSIVKGFAGMRVIDNELTFKPFIPVKWKSFSFKIRFRGQIKQVTITDSGYTVQDI